MYKLDLFCIRLHLTMSSNVNTGSIRTRSDDLDVQMDDVYDDDTYDFLDDGSTDANGKYKGFEYGQYDEDYNADGDELDYSDKESCSVGSETKRNDSSTPNTFDDGVAPFDSITTFKTPLTPMPSSKAVSISSYSPSEDGEISPQEDVAEDKLIPPQTDSVKPLKYTLEIREEDNMTKDDEIKFKYQFDLRVYVNRCMFIRNTKIGKRVGFAPSLPKTKDFVMCWNCNDWIPPRISPVSIPLCSQTHMHSKYVFEKMFGYFCSWGCAKKYIYETMSAHNKSKYMRSLLQLRRIFYPEDNNKPIETVEPRTCTTLYGGQTNPEEYYSKMVKINLPPLQEDICFTLNALSVASTTS